MSKKYQAAAIPSLARMPLVWITQGWFLLFALPTLALLLSLPVSSLAQSLQGNTTFRITFTSDGGHSITRTITLNVGPDSSIAFTPPTGLKVGRNRTLVIDALEAISGENAAYTVTCGDATGVDATKMTVTRSSSGDGCSYTVDPVDSLATGSQGDTTFSVAFTSTGGATASGTFTVNIGPDSTITYAPPTGLKLGRNRTLTIDASDYATEASSTYTITCGDATGVDSRRLAAVSHTGNSCTFTIDPVDSLALSLRGDTSFSIPYASDGGATATGSVTVNIGPDSTITFTPTDWPQDWSQPLFYPERFGLCERSQQHLHDHLRRCHSYGCASNNGCLSF